VGCIDKKKLIKELPLRTQELCLVILREIYLCVNINELNDYYLLT
jgi:hypothetical protein